MMRLSTVELLNENMLFSSGHFVVFSSTVRENLHGHTYNVRALIVTEINDEGLSFDLRFYQAKLYDLCHQLDLIVLIPGLCKHLKITEESDYCYIHFNTEKIIFLKRDIKILPIYNVTLEELSSWLLQQLLLDKDELEKHRIQSIEIKVLSGSGRAASTAWKK
jgi:6-pyruvoyltetrahydropterin/6-carboxytetrahydropterin synthase